MPRATPSAPGHVRVTHKCDFSCIHLFLNIVLGLFPILCVYKENCINNPRKRPPARTSCLGSGLKSIFLGNRSFLPTPPQSGVPCCLAPGQGKEGRHACCALHMPCSIVPRITQHPILLMEKFTSPRSRDWSQMVEPGFKLRQSRV